MSEKSKSKVDESVNFDGVEWGYDLYPERKQPRKINFINWFFKMQSRDNIEQYKCEKKVVAVIKTSRLNFLYFII